MTAAAGKSLTPRALIVHKYNDFCVGGQLAGAVIVAFYDILTVGGGIRVGVEIANIARNSFFAAGYGRQFGGEVEVGEMVVAHELILEKCDWGFRGESSVDALGIALAQLVVGNVLSVAEATAVIFAAAGMGGGAL